MATITSIVVALITAAGSITVAMIQRSPEPKAPPILLPPGVSVPSRRVTWQNAGVVLLTILLGAIIGFFIGQQAVLPGSTRIALKSYHGKYVTALSADSAWAIKANSATPGFCGNFTLIWLDRSNNVVALKTCYDRYVTAMGNQQGWDWKLRAETRTVSDWEKFTRIDLGKGQIALRSFHDGRYVTAMDNQPGWDWELRAETLKLGDWETFDEIQQPSISIYAVLLIAFIVVTAGSIAAVMYLKRKKSGR